MHFRGKSEFSSPVIVNCTIIMSHTNFGSFKLFLTLESFILYVSHPEPQVRYFLVQALGRKKELPLPFKLQHKPALGNCIATVWERFQIFPAKGIKHSQTDVPLERIREAPSTHGDKYWAKRRVMVNYCETAFIQSAAVRPSCDLENWNV